MQIALVPAGARLALPLAHLLSVCSVAVAQEPAPPPPPDSQQPRPGSLEPEPAPRAQGRGQQVVVTASRTEQDPFESPRSIDVVTSERLERAMFRSVPQALRELPGAMIQETSPGQGSPFLRGFTGYNNLFLIDGIRLNNSTFRAGPNQWWATVDVLGADRIEVLRGPASTQWGSDAVGGTVQVFTRSPTLYAEDGVRYGGEVYGRYATAEDSPAVRGEVQVGVTREGGLRTGALIGGTARSFGDIEGGRATGLQPNTAHKENAFDVKVEHWLEQDTKLVFLHQQFAQNNVPRTHSTAAAKPWRGAAVGSDLRRDSDQYRELTYLQLHRTGMDGAVQAMRWSLSWQTQQWIEDRVRSSGAQTIEDFTVGTLGAFAQFESDTGVGRLTYGVDYYRDHVRSSRRGSTYTLGDEIQGKVADDATYDLLGVFVQDMLAVTDDVAVEAGVRYTYASVDADSVRDPVTSARIGVSDSWDELVANLHLRVELTDEWNVYGGASQGFRAPSLADLTSFDLARSGEQEVPSTTLEEERYLGYEVGTKVRTGRVRGQAAWFYTDVQDQILRFPTGATTASGDTIVTKGNVGDGYVQGVELQYGIELVERLELIGAHTYQYGRIENFENAASTPSNDYPSRLMPLTNLVGLRWQNVEGDFHAETEVVRAEDADRLSFGDQRDTQRIPPGGTPSYTVWNARCGWQIDDRASLEVAVENLTDVDYRVHGSGSNSLGRNFVFGMRVRF